MRISGPMRRVRNGYMAVRFRLRRGKCRWVTYSFFSQRWMPPWLRRQLFMTWPLSRVNWCDEPATRIAHSDHFAGYDNLPVCVKHLKDVELSNDIHRMIQRGEL